MKGKRQRKLRRTRVLTQEKYNQQLREINKIIEVYVWKEGDAKECMDKIVKVVYETE